MSEPLIIRSAVESDAPALLVLLLWPVVWLVSLPFRLVGITFEALFALLRAVLFLPARLLGYRGHTRSGQS